MAALRSSQNFGRAKAWSGVGLVACLLVLWEASARLGWMESRNWPAFSVALVALVQGTISGELPRLLLETISLMLVGYGAGCAAGIALGLILGLSPQLNRFFSPIVETLRPIPISALVPPLILFLGVGSALKIFVVAFCAFFPLLINTISGVRDGSEMLRNTGRTFRLSRTAMLWKIVLPGALPAILAGIRISLAIALIVMVIAEMLAGSTGLGYFIVQTQYAMQPAPMYAAVVCLSLVGYAINRLIVFIERHALPWHGAS